jgi:2-furoyl-CoA dehydrogenase FAD binding subunit
MKPAAFDYARPDSRREATRLLYEYGDDARVLAGGQSLMAGLNMRLDHPGLLVDIGGIENLAYIERRENHLAVGAGTTQAELMARPTLAEEVPILPQALPYVGHVQTRNRGTVCGSIAYADPSAELPLCLVTLGGEVILENSNGKQRRIAARDFYQGILTTAREPNELIIEVCFPLAQAGRHYRFTEIAMRHGDFAIVALALAGADEAFDLGIGGVADRSVARHFERRGFTEALNEYVWSLGAQDDAHASAAYRRQLVRELGARLIEDDGQSGNGTQ